MIPARWFDLGRTDPLTFHSTYAGIAAARSGDLLPAVVWARVGAHVCLGQSHGMCELSEALDVPVVRRPLGGGVVWVDEMQLCYALIAPLDSVPLQPADWFDWALRPAIATFRGFGLAVERHAEDLWVGGRKIAGSGAATIGRAAVVASSFLMRFPRERFARAVSAVPETFRAHLLEALDLAMTDWAENGAVPEERSVRAAFQRALAQELRWRVERGAFDEADAAEIRSWRAELSEPIEAGTRRVPGGMKLNAALTLATTGGAPILLRRMGAGESGVSGTDRAGAESMTMGVPGGAVDCTRRRSLLKGALAAAAAAAVSPLRVVQEALALGAIESGVYRIKGSVSINGSPASERMPLRAGDVIVTDRNAELVFVANKDAFLVRENTRVELGGPVGAIILTGFRVVTGAVLSVFERGRPKRVVTGTATVGIRGTGLYVESEPERSYICTCYGVSDIEAIADPSYRETVETTHHDEPRYVYASGEAMIAKATMQNHGDAELELLESLVGREVPFDPEAYK